MPKILGAGIYLNRSEIRLIFESHNTLIRIMRNLSNDIDLYHGSHDLGLIDTLIDTTFDRNPYNEKGLADISLGSCLRKSLKLKHLSFSLLRLY